MVGFIKRDECLRVREVLQRGDYSHEGISRSLGETEWLTPRAIDLPRFSWSLSDPTHHNTLVRLFLLGAAIPLKQVRRALEPMTVEQWIDAELLHPPSANDFIRSAVRLTPIQDLVLAADCPETDALNAPADFVMSPGGTSIGLGYSAIRKSSCRTLDLGTGCGYLGLLASSFSDRVIATDRNERAGKLAHFNALLNDVEVMESRVGDLFEPVQGERFDLVLSNPPFVITPGKRLMFRDSGMRGDEFCRRLMRGVPEYLEEGGFCQMLGNFARRTGSPWREELAEWFTGLGCDTLVLTTDRESIDKYTMNWITATESQDTGIVPGLFKEWMDYYEREQIEEVIYFHVSLRRRDSVANWIHVDKAGVKIVSDCGWSILDRFANLDWLAGMPADKALLGKHLVLTPDARLVQEHVMTAEGPKVAENRMEMRGGLRHYAQLDVHVVRLLVYCDGSQPLQDLLSGAAEALGISTNRMVQAALPVVRHLMERGFLQPSKSSR
jgi:hypothetical protein